jgi:hypothetical protein
MIPEHVRAIADAVLYEGYILWPYRRSALKNQRRFTFGGVYPPEHARAHPDDPSEMQIEVLLEGGPGARVTVTVRFLHVVHRAVVNARGERVDELVSGGERYLAWEEAVEREITCPQVPIGALPRTVGISIAGGRAREDIRGGALVRTWEPLEGEVGIQASPAAPGTWRVTVRILNTTPFAGTSREQALDRTFCSTHVVLHADGGAFVSLTDPPPALAAAVAECQNRGTWPVLAGEPGARDTILSSPIILEDHPRVAPESPGDLFDGGEIDQLLILNILALSEEEKAEMAASDPRAREILERTEALTPEQLMALHGTIREYGMAR